MNSPEDKKTILFLITQPAPWGGAQRYVFDVATHLSRTGWRVTVACGEPADGTLYQKLRAVGVSTRCVPSLTRAVRPFTNLRAIAEICALCRELNPGLVHLNSSMAGVLGAIGARMAGVKKIIYTMHGLVTKEPLPFPVILTYWLAEWIAGKFRDLTICVSEDDRRAVIHQHIAPPARTVTIPIGIDPNIPLLPKNEARASLLRYAQNVVTGRDLSLQPKWIGTIAGLYKTKGLDTLIKAAYLLTSRVVRANDCPPLQFVIIGEGPERVHLESLIKIHGLHSFVFLLGAIPDAAHCLKAFDCFVLPSVKEGMPYVILEAKAAGIPIVTSNVGGIPEVLREDASHRLILPAHPKALARAIEETIQKRGNIPLSEKTHNIPSLAHMVERTVTEYLRPAPPAR